MKFVSSFIFTVLFWPGISSAGSTPRWAFLAVTVAVSFFIYKTTITTSHLLFAIILSWAIVSGLWSQVTPDWMLGCARILIVGGVFLVGCRLNSMRPILIGAALGLLINSIIVIAQVEGWQGIAQVSPPAGLFLNKNLSAEFAVLVFVGLIYERMYLLSLPVLPSIFLIHSRGAYVALASVAVIMAFKRWPRTIAVLIGVSLSGAALYMLIHADLSVVERFSIWQDTLNGYSWFGRGDGQFYATYPDHASRVDTLAQRPDHAHNDLLELGYEFGLGALFIAAFLYSVWRVQMATERAILLAFAVEGLFSFPFYMPATAACFALVAGRLAGAGPSLRDDFYACRTGVRRCVGAFTRFSNGVVSSSGSEQALSPGVPDSERASVPVHSVPASRYADHRID